MNLNVLIEKLTVIDLLVAQNSKVSSDACEGIRKSNGQLPKAFSPKKDVTSDN